jgi:hypothetical protein
MPGGVRQCYEHVLEQVLLTIFGESDLHLSGSIIRTTLDKSLQTELDKDKFSLSDKEADASDGVLVVRQTGQIRAFACGMSRVREIRESLDSLGPRYSGYEVSTASPDSISRDEIILATEKK